jgi:hypothetical protein
MRSAITFIILSAFETMISPFFGGTATGTIQHNLPYPIGEWVVIENFDLL